MLKKIFLAIVVLVLAVLVFATTRPDTYNIERSITIHATPDRVFNLVNDFHEWHAWSPFEKLDTAMTRTFGGANAGVGATYAWAGNRKAGQGTMEITESTPYSKIVVGLNFLKPMKNTTTVAFTFVPVNDSTRVTWSMYGPNQYISKVMGIFMSIDRMVGKDFEAGLGNLKAVAER